MNLYQALAKDFHEVVKDLKDENVMLKGIMRKFRYNIELRVLCINMVEQNILEIEEWTQKTKHYWNIGQRLAKSSESETQEANLRSLPA